MCVKYVLMLSVAFILFEHSSSVCMRRRDVNPERKGIILHLTVEGDIEQLDKSKASYKTIIDKSVDVLIQGEQEEHTIEFLNDFYFTADQKSSIWAKAIEERHIQCYKHEEKLRRMQNVLKKIYLKWLNCIDLKTSRKQCRCFFELHSLLEDGAKEFKMGGNELACEAILFDLNVAYNLMSLMIYHLTIHVAIFAPAPAITIRNAYFKIADNMLDTLDDVVKNITKARLATVTDVEICQVDELLWLDYRGKCECYNCEKKTFADGEVGSGSFTGIEGNGDLERFNAQVIDRANNTLICDEVDQAKDKDDQHSVEIDLYAKCLDKKKTYEAKLSKETKRFYEKRVSKIRQSFPTLWGMNRRKYSRKS